ncbi:PfkB family carbohydrate kinase [Microtetraspora malaysiensis]|uniref:PfkB family carbohydrate kinase n=1 Tax=Microtetraspora malaysiensis TaxID=161358 RepID=UPI003D8A549C
MVDSTGAGDAFAAGFLAALLSGLDPRAALENGCRAGAVAVAQVGGRPPVPGATAQSAGIAKELYPIDTD